MNNDNQHDTPPPPPSLYAPPSPPPRDITENRHGGNVESVAAFERVKHSLTQSRLRVLNACRRYDGVTCRELALELEVDMNVISGRFSELKKDRLIEKIGVRDRCGIYRSVDFKPEPPEGV